LPRAALFLPSRDRFSSREFFSSAIIDPVPARAHDAVKNQATTSIKLSGNIVEGPTIAPGATQQVSFTEVGNGTSCIQLAFETHGVSDSLDVLAFAPAITPSGGSNLIPAGNQDFSGWAAYMGASVTLTQGQTPFIFDNMDSSPSANKSPATPPPPTNSPAKNEIPNPASITSAHATTQVQWAGSLLLILSC
jgi:hypothetical protein